MGLLDDAIREHLDLKRRRGADPTEVERQEREVLGPVRPRGERDLADPSVAPEDDLEHEPLPYDEDPWEDEPAASPRAAGAFDGDDEDEFEDVAPPRASEAHGGYYPSEPEAPHAADPYRADTGFAANGPAHGYADEALHRYADEPAHGYADETAHGYANEPVHRYADEPTGPSGGYRGATGGDPFPAHYVPEPARPNTDEPTAEFTLEEIRAAEHDPHGEDARPSAPGEDVLQETPDFLQDTPDHDRLWFEQRPPRDFDFDG